MITLISAIITVIIIGVFLFTGFLKQNVDKKMMKTLFIVFMTTYTVITLTYNGLMSRKDFSIKNPNQYIIRHTLVASQSRLLLYEVDFDKNKILCREGNTGAYLGRVPEENNYLVKKLIEKIISDENNLVEFSDEEKQAFLKEGVYTFNVIETYNGKVYYAKDMKTSLALDGAIAKYSKQY